MKIRDKNGNIHDIAKSRKYAESSLLRVPGGTSPDHPGHTVLAAFDALECVLSIPYIQYRDGASSFDHAHALSRNATLREVREAAGLVEDAP